MAVKKRRGGAWARPTRRWAIYLRDARCGADGRIIQCVYCQQSLTELLADDIFLTLDHIDPGGGDGTANLTTACYSCNTVKGQKSLARFARDLGVPAGSVRRRLSVRRHKDLTRYRVAAQLILGAVEGVPRAEIVHANDWLAQYQFRDDDPEYEYLREAAPDHCVACGRDYDGPDVTF